MKRIFLLGVLLYATSATAPSASAIEHPKGCLEADIIFLLDHSGSVEGYESFIADAVSNFLNRVELADDGIKVSIISFQSLVYSSTPLTSDDDELSTALSLFVYYKAGGGTGAASSLELAQQYFETSQKAREREVVKIIVLISDGELGDPDLSILQAQILKSEGVIIFAINCNPTGDAGIRALQSIVSDPTVGYFETDYSTLNNTLQGMDMCM